MESFNSKILIDGKLCLVTGLPIKRTGEVGTKAKNTLLSL